MLALIPARGGSKRLARKNLRHVGGTPLVVHSIEHALQSRHVTRVVVSTDDPEIADVSARAGAEVPFLRPAHLATDSATDLAVFAHCLEWLREHERYQPELVVQLRPTAPLRRVPLLDHAIEVMSTSRADSMRSVTVAPLTPYKMWKLRDDRTLEPVATLADVSDAYDQPRQALPKTYVQDGFVDVVRPRTTVERGTMAGNRILAFTHADLVVDIDDEDSLAEAELVYRRDLKRRPGNAEQLSRRIGVMQGRLTAAPPDVLQVFPGPRWAEELMTAAACGLSHVEVFVEQRPTSVNPLSSDAGAAELRASARRAGIAAPALCVDCVIASSIADEDVVDYLAELLARARTAAVELVVLPLFGRSNPAEHGWKAIASGLARTADVAGIHGLELCIESSLSGGATQEFLGYVGDPRIRVCFDTGNSVGYGHDPVDDVEQLGPLVTHVHVKDKTRAGVNVALGEGAVDFEGVFATLIRGGFDGLLTLETPRGVDPVSTAEDGRDFVRRRLASVSV